MNDHPAMHDTTDDESGHESGPLRIPLLVSSGPLPQRAVRRKALVRFGILVAAVGQIVTAAFAFVAHRNHPDVALGLTTLFSFALCAVLSVWIRSDAKYAYETACELGYVSPVVWPGHGVRIATGCPRRWLAVLHVELQGCAVASGEPVTERKRP